MGGCWPCFLDRLKRGQTRPHIAEFLDALGEIAYAASRRPNLICVRIQGPSVLTKRKMNSRQLRGTKLIQELPTCFPQNLIGDALDFIAVVGVNGKVGAAIEINARDRSAIAR